MDDRDAYRCAPLLIKGHGERALGQAMLRKCELEGDKAGVAAWVRIIAAVQVLRRTERVSGQKLQ